MSKKELNNSSVLASGTYTLPKSHILRGRRNFDRLFENSQRISSSSINLRYTIYENPTEGFLVGFISKKKLGNAVKRTRIRRLMREAYRLNQDIIRDICQQNSFGIHFVLMAKSTHATFEQIQKDVITLLQQLRTRLLQQNNQ